MSAIRGNGSDTLPPPLAFTMKGYKFTALFNAISQASTQMR
ncbi:hypothetical protein SVI_1704 [Shewanella violacea DSS12]|uniref:Uncharacterized protein n=1 Tax=Shewanella violacea (strain JCM 10179 / CIP 106290 / LMG 19151 / DSS12) TaxID=637905 RepID=D4ZJ26_SHEVD|nr:hypothetical protein SVI_1704 [Shewanella violacea DSS12]